MKKHELLHNDQEISNELNAFFKNTVSNLENPNITNQFSDDILDPVEKCIDNYEFRSSMLLNRNRLTFKTCFHSML